MEIGTTFRQTSEGYTVSGYGQSSVGYEIVEMIGDKYSCKLLWDDSVMSVNPAYRVNFTEDQIKSLIAAN